MEIYRNIILILVAITSITLYMWMMNCCPVHIDNFSSDVEYDYIIVGAGTAGCVLANRLTEDPNVTVLLLEAGPVDSSHFVSIPLTQSEILLSEMDWKYKTVPQKHGFLTSKNQEVYWPAGKVFGGSSSLNGMIYARGIPEDYNHWAEMGADGWTYDEVLPYFLKSENSLLKEESEYHSTEGPFTITYPSHITELEKAFIEAGKKLGYRVGDYNRESRLEFSLTQSTVKDGKRVSTSTAFLHPAMKRSNLFIGTGVTVRKVVFENNKAMGVSYVHYDKNFETVVKAKREIILSAGAVGSPHILLLSGVGPSTQLKEIGIDTISDVPVGENLQDHMILPLEYIIHRDHNRYDTVIHPSTILSLATFYQYIINGDGPLSSPTITGVAFLELDTGDNHTYPLEIEFCRAFGSGATDFWGKFDTHKQSLYDGNLDDLRGYSLLLSPLHTKSVGELYLNKTHPYSQPLIDPQYFSEPDDIKAFKKAIKFALKLGDTPPLSSKGVKLFAAMMDAPYQFDTEEFWNWYIENMAYSTFHYGGTCKMGSVQDPSVVVDPKLRVKGVTGLRVVDASVMPTLPSGNPAATVIMIAEKVADMIKAQGSTNMAYL